MNINHQRRKLQADSDPLVMELDKQRLALRAKLKQLTGLRWNRWKTVMARLLSRDEDGMAQQFQAKHRKASKLYWREHNQPQVDDFRY